MECIYICFLKKKIDHLHRSMRKKQSLVFVCVVCFSAGSCHYAFLMRDIQIAKFCNQIENVCLDTAGFKCRPPCVAIALVALTNLSLLSQCL